MGNIASDAAPAGTGTPAWRRLGHALVSADSYGLVLLLVIATYVVSVSVTEAQAASIVLTVQLATVWVTLRTSHARRATRLVADIVLCLAAVVAAGSFFVHQPGDQLGGIFAVCCLLYLIAPFSIVRYLILRREIDTETLLGAIAAYLLIGLFFAFAYKAASEFGSVPFFGSAGAGSLSQDLFFSFVTMTTVGYGNLVPAANPGQTFAVLEALIGQLFLVVAVGKIINGMRSGQNQRPGLLGGSRENLADQYSGRRLKVQLLPPVHVAVAVLYPRHPRTPAAIAGPGRSCARCPATRGAGLVTHTGVKALPAPEGPVLTGPSGHLGLGQFRFCGTAACPGLPHAVALLRVLAGTDW